MPPPVYTLEQADRALPLIRAIVRDLHTQYLRMRARTAMLGRKGALRRAEDHGDLPREVRDTLAEIRSLTRELEELGVTIEHPELGVVSLRATVEGREVHLCWKLGEPALAYFYPVDGTYEGRMPLPRARA